jgi:flagellar hook-associated protein 2
MVTGPEGASNGFTLTSSDTTNLPFASSNLQDSCDAVLTVDGVAITSSSNAVTDAIGGVTLNLLATTSAATLGLSNDTTAVRTKIQALVTSYNDAMSIFDEVTNPNSKLETYGATLVNNSSVRSLRDTLRSMMTAESTTPTSDGTYGYLHDIGVDLDSAGKLSLSTATLDTALASNFSDVVYLMTGNQEALSVYDTTTNAGIAGEASRSLASALSASGTVTIESANATDRIARYKDDLTKLEDRMTQLLARYTKQFSAMDSIVGQTKSTQTGLTSSFAGLMAMYTNK